MTRTTLVLCFVLLGVIAAGCDGSSSPVDADGGVAPTTCGAASSACGTRCVNLISDDTNCGQCGSRCAANEACAGGTCLRTDCSAADCSGLQVCSSDRCRGRDCVGVVCGSGQTCFEGNCQAETCSGQACAAGSVCRSGQCTDVACIGVACGNGSECRRGQCVTGCTPDAVCSPTDPCQRGATSCQTGTAVCVAKGAVAPGTSCGAGKVCDAAGGCVACSDGQACGTNPSACKTGVTACATGTPVCLDSATNAVERTACGAGKVCLGGVCSTDPCSGTSCQAPTCFDGLKNGTETEIDCGGTCSACVPAVPIGILSQTLGGAPQTTFEASQAVYGRVLNLTATNAQGCVEIVGSTNGFCATVSNWTTLPNADWTFDSASKEWRAVFAANRFPPGQYKNFWRNSQTGAAATPVVLTLTGPVILYSETLEGPAKTSFPSHTTVYSRMEGLTATNTQACVEIVEVTDGACANPPSGWTDLPNAGNTFDVGAGKWRSTFTPNQFPAGSYRSFARNKLTGAKATPVVLTLTGPVIISSETPEGPAKTTFKVDQTVYGRIEGLPGTGAQACVEIVGVTDGACGNPPSGWTNLPNAENTFDGTKWRSIITPKQFPAGSYREFARNAQTGAYAYPVVLTLTAPRCEWSAVTAGPVSPPSTVCSSSNVGATTFVNGYTWTCTCS